MRTNERRSRQSQEALRAAHRSQGKIYEPVRENSKSSFMTNQNQSTHNNDVFQKISHSKNPFQLTSTSSIISPQSIASKNLQVINSEENEYHNIVNKKRKSFEEIRDQIRAIIQLLEEFKRAIQFYHQQKNTDSSLDGSNMSSEESEQLASPDLGNLEIHIERIKHMILQHLASNHRLACLHTQFKQIPYYSYEYLNDLIQFLVVMIQRLERNYTVMSIANINLFFEKRARGAEEEVELEVEVEVEGLTTVLSNSDLSSNSTSSSSMMNSNNSSSPEKNSPLAEEYDDQTGMTMRAGTNNENDQSFSTMAIDCSPRKRVRFSTERMEQTFQTFSESDTAEDEDDEGERMTITAMEEV